MSKIDNVVEKSDLQKEIVNLKDVEIPNLVKEKEEVNRLLSLEQKKVECKFSNKMSKELMSCRFGSREG